MKLTRTNFIVIFAICCFVSLLVFLPDSDPAKATESEPVVRHVSAVLRQDTPNSGWYVVDNASHKPLGGLSVAYATEDRIVLNMTHTDVIYSMLCGGDELYAPWGYTCGISAGLDQLTIRIGYWGSVIDPRPLAAGPYANFWIKGTVKD